MTDDEQKYIKLCDEVNRRAQRIMSWAMLGHANKAAELAHTLSEYVSQEMLTIIEKEARRRHYVP